MKDLSRATAEQVHPIISAIANIPRKLYRVDVSTVLQAALEEIVPGVRYGTISWVKELVLDKAFSTYYDGQRDLSIKLDQVAEMLSSIVDD